MTPALGFGRFEYSLMRAAVASVLTAAHPDFEDAVQNAMIRAWRNLGRFHIGCVGEPPCVGAELGKLWGRWLWVIGMRSALNTVRTVRRRRECRDVEVDALPGQPVSDPVALLEAREQLARLMSVDLTERQLVALCGVSVGNDTPGVRWHRHKARRRVTAALADTESDRAGCEAVA